MRFHRYRTAVATAALCLALLPTRAGADVIALDNGQRLEGELRDLGNGKVRIELASGSLTLPKSRVTEVVSAATAAEIVRTARARLAPNDVDGHLELAAWAEVEREHTLARSLYRQVLEIDPDQPDARRALGFLRYKDAWLTEQEIRLARGDVFFRGEWMTPGRRESILNRERQEREAVRAEIREDRQRDEERRAKLDELAAAAEARYRAGHLGFAASFGSFSLTRPVFGGSFLSLAPFRVGQIQVPVHQRFGYTYFRPPLAGTIPAVVSPRSPATGFASFGVRR